jgi:flagellar basal body-associated protein FliL
VDASLKIVIMVDEDKILEEKISEDGTNAPSEVTGKSDTNIADSVDDDDESEISLDNIDDIIADEDPEFSKDMGDMQGEAEDVKKELVADGEDDKDNSNLEPESFIEDEDDKKEAKKSKIKELFKKIAKPVIKILSPLKILSKPYLYINFQIKSFLIRFKNRIYILMGTFFTFIINDSPGLLKKGVSNVTSQIARFYNWIFSYKSLTIKNKILVIMLLLLIAAFLMFSNFIVKSASISFFKNDLLLGLHQVAQKEFRYSPDEKLQKFYFAFPQPEHTFLLKKIVVNLTPEYGHTNPMGTFEFHVSIDSKDTALEIKDREQEFLDILQRTVEGMRYKEMVTKQGKNKIKNNIKFEFNRALNQGRVKTLYIRTIVLKP